MKEHVFFFQRFLKHRGKIGSVLPSSSFLVKQIVKMIPFDRVETLVELGGGTGAVTASLLKRRKKETTMVIFEPDEQFFGLLEKRFHPEKKVVFVKKRAENLKEVLESLNLQSADCIVSSLPFASFGKKTSARIFGEIKKNLSIKGIFVLYQYTPFMVPLLMKYFKIYKVAFAPLNVPPAFVLCCASHALDRE